MKTKEKHVESLTVDKNSMSLAEDKVVASAIA